MSQPYLSHPKRFTTTYRPLLTIIAFTITALWWPTQNATAAPASNARSVLGHQVKTIEGDLTSLSAYKGRALLIVNTASRCGYTSQYRDLVKLQEQYQAQGFTVLAFPCNDFGGQEPGSASEIKSFCESNFEINFPLFDKLHARGPKKSPLYQTLTSLPAPLGGEIGWNFTKFIVNRKGEVIARFAPHVSPTSDKVKEALERALNPQK